MITKSNFVVKFYNWALADFQREIQNDYRLLGEVTDSAAQRAVEIMRALPPRLQPVLASGLVKRSHLEATQALGVSLSEKEEELVQATLNAPISAIAPIKWSKSEMRKCIGEQMGSVFDTKRFKWDHNMCEVSQEIAGTHIATLLDVGSGINKLSYEHTIVFPNGDKYGRVSILSWLGIAFETDWNLATDPRKAAFGLEKGL